jgi:hypothetical protein
MPISSTEIFDESPALEGPDYVALVIEWDQLADRIEGELAAEPTERIVKPFPVGAITAIAAAAASLLGVFALARWGIHRLRAA